MKGCLTHLLLAILLVANGYAIWQVHCLRLDVARLQGRVETVAPTAQDSLLDTAQSALEAVRQGRVSDARRELERLAEQLEHGQHVASHRKAELQAQVARARQALTEKREEAAKRIENLVRELSHKVSKDAQGEERRLAELSSVAGGLRG